MMSISAVKELVKPLTEEGRVERKIRETQGAPSDSREMTYEFLGVSLCRKNRRKKS